MGLDTLSSFSPMFNKTDNLLPAYEKMVLITQATSKGSDKPEHYENTPIQIYRKFHHQKLKTFRLKTLIFFIFLLKT